MLRRTRFFLRGIAVCLAVAATSACSGDPTGNDLGEHFPGKPNYSGVITQVEHGGLRFLIQKEMDAPITSCTPDDYSYVAVNPNPVGPPPRWTELRWESGSSAEPADLVVGMQVEVWGWRDGLAICGGSDLHATGIRLNASVAR